MAAKVPLAVVETGDNSQDQAAAPAAPLSPARAALAKARQDRANAEAVRQEASRVQLVAEGLITERDRIKAGISEIESINASVVERWATSGAAGAPELPGDAELDTLCRDLTEAERLAAAVNVAMPALTSRIETAQRSVSAPTLALREEIVAIIAEEMKVELDTIREEERRTATRRATVEAAIRVLDLVAARYRVPNAGAAAQRLRLSVPAAVAATDALIRDQIP